MQEDRAETLPERDDQNVAESFLYCTRGTAQRNAFFLKISHPLLLAKESGLQQEMQDLRQAMRNADVNQRFTQLVPN
jgi:hypothetical protein